MLRRIFIEKKYTYNLILIIILSSMVWVGFGIYSKFEFKSQGKLSTNIEIFNDSRTIKSIFNIGPNSSYYNDNLPNLKLESTTEKKYYILASILSDTPSTFNFNMALSNEYDSLIFSTITRNDSLSNILYCYTNEDFKFLNEKWLRESEKDEYGKIIGYNYMLTNNLITKEDPKFDGVLNSYLKNNKFISNKLDYKYCNPNSKYNEILFKSQSQGVQTGLMRIFVNTSSVTNQILTIDDLDQLIKSSKI
jgi:hypothetical protein